MDNTITTEQLISEIMAQYGTLISTRKEGDVDKNQMAEAWGISDSTSRDRLEGLVKKGYLVRVKVVSNTGKTMIVYRKAV